MTLQEKQLMPMRVITHPDSIGEIVTDLKKRGYHLRFRREATCLITSESFMVGEYYHFEDGSNPDSERMLYAVSSIDGLKSFVVEACFVYEDNISPEMTQKPKWESALSAET